MLYQPEYVLLIALAVALIVGDPGWVSPLALGRSAVRLLANDLPRGGVWAAPAGVLLLILAGGPAVGGMWVLIYGLPVGLRLVAPAASPIVALVLAALILRLTLWLPPVWMWMKWGRAQPRAAVPHELVTRCARELAAPVLLFAFLGIYAAVVYRIALEVSRALGDYPEPNRIAAPAVWLAYLPAAPAHRLVLLFALVAARATGAMRVPDSGVAQLEGRAATRPVAAAAAATMALALLVIIW